MFQRLPIALAQVKSGNTSESFFFFFLNNIIYTWHGWLIKN